jgi:NADPH2:quinone reductase
MRAIQLNRFGGPDVLDAVEMPKPLPQAGEVLVRIHAAGVNFFEVLMRGDRYAVTPQLPSSSASRRPGPWRHLAKAWTPR